MDEISKVSIKESTQPESNQPGVATVLVVKQISMGFGL